MSIDWITVAAQIANFLVLVWLLKRFLYRPILDGIDAREAEIATRMQQALDAKAQAQAAEQAFHDQTHALNTAQAEMAETIRETALAQRDVLLTEAQARLEEQQAAWVADQAAQAARYSARLHGAGAQALLALTRKAVTDLADETLEARMAQHLIRQLDPMTADLRRAAGAATEAVITSHDTLPGSVQDDLGTALRGLFPQVALRFVVRPDQAPGLMIQLGGAQLVWTVASYIDGLGAMVDAALADADAQGPADGR